MKRKTIIWILVLAVIGSVIIFRMSNKNKVKDVGVKTAQVQQGDIKAYLSTTGTVKSKSSKDYYPLQGKVKKVNVKVGDAVTTGQVLVEYDVMDPNLAVKQAQIQYDNSVLQKKILQNSDNQIKNNISDLDKQISDLDKQIEELQKSPEGLQKLADMKDPNNPIVKRQTLKNTRDSLKPISNEQYKQADNAIALAKLGLDSAKQNLSKSQDKIVADIDGVVTALTAVEGTAAMAAQPAVTVQNLENLKVLVSVGKYDANRIKLDQEATVKSGDKELKAKVAAIDPAAKKSVSATGAETTLGVEIDILERAENLKIDFDTDVDVLLGQVNNVVKVPAESIRTNKAGKTFIYAVENGKAVEREVKLGLQSDMEAQIVEGAKAGEKVILNPSENIKSGTAVKETVGDEK
jgi:HlyD family secretion protein